jgi:hypothetical protein
MHDLATTSTASPGFVSSQRAAARWMVNIVGIPLAGYLGWLVSGPVDGVGPSLLGAAITGAALGAVQVWALGRTSPPAAAWITATGLGLMAGLGIGAAVVDYETGLSDLVVQGAVSGLGVGAAQALVLARRLGMVALVWPPALGVIWAAGWAISTKIGVEVDQQFVIFGASGAAAVAVLTVVLPLGLNKLEAVRS